MVSRENKNNDYAKFGGQTKSIMIFSELAYCSCHSNIKSISSRNPVNYVENVENNSTNTLFKMEINSNVFFKLRNNSSIPLLKDLESVL